ncbi:hypothetical protein GUITHDRAFT_146537 [Guillardia theta CCMP2712]|uniref:CSD domain-containing protein n=1 Tax=Guillardia theta (strain CCMP2712) TaxID=905079 RepID=L1IGF5_GUITC|nr:hypothetical protein GUITHDRAFT_146537 [Guillardia theta CCMP2712]EKX35331.1 hypothetical protein GUITHDRAFT_146537 [Guillardia theta CCMP2712]|eukprot:XP_005822311.1 hypothetical protein GUITHDRAFT_146537 [Guillardia theta CCMP2712]
MLSFTSSLTLSEIFLSRAVCNSDRGLLQNERGEEVYSSQLNGGNQSVGYYGESISKRKGQELKSALHAVISKHVPLSYQRVWEALEDIDGGQDGCQPNSVADVYTGKCWRIYTDRCDKVIERENFCYNREHAWPKSWWGGFEEGGGSSTRREATIPWPLLKANLFHGDETKLKQVQTFRTQPRAVGNSANSGLLDQDKDDRKVPGTVKFFNKEKGFGFATLKDGREVYIHQSNILDNVNLRKMDSVKLKVLSGTKGLYGKEVRRVEDKCFEPPDHVKGDLARAYFYVSVRYEGEFQCCQRSLVNKNKISKTYQDMLRSWHKKDPVSEREKQRNEKIYTWQKNRNPFIDMPELVDAIPDF